MSDIYRVGAIVKLKVTEVNGMQITATMNPRRLNCEFRKLDLKSGMVRILNCWHRICHWMRHWHCHCNIELLNGLFHETSRIHLVLTSHNCLIPALSHITPPYSSPPTSHYITSWQVLPGAVSSVEDHGYVIDLGIEGVTSFLTNKKTASYIEDYNDGWIIYEPCLTSKLY